MYLATLDQCTSEKLSKNPIVDSWSIDAPLEWDKSKAVNVTTDSSKRRREASVENNNHLHSRSSPTSASAYKLQNNSPAHLQWLSTLSRYTGLKQGSYLAFDDLIFDDPPIDPATAPLVYVLEKGFLPFHQVRIACLFLKSRFCLSSGKATEFGDVWSFAYSSQSYGTPFARLSVSVSGEPIAPRSPLNDHGVCMASLAVGAYSGMGKRARLVTVDFDVVSKPLNLPVSAQGNIEYGLASSAMFGFLAIMEHLMDNQGRNNAVVTMSFSESSPVHCNCRYRFMTCRGRAQKDCFIEPLTIYGSL
jgi:hypothetical protein